MVSRLCEPIDGLDSAQVASCLGELLIVAWSMRGTVATAGLDPSGFRSTLRGDGEGGREGEGEGGGSGERYADCQLPTVICPACAKLVSIAGATVSVLPN